MSDTLYAGVARRIINPPLGINKAGLRLFADPYPGSREQSDRHCPGFEQRRCKSCDHCLRSDCHSHSDRLRYSPSGW